MPFDASCRAVVAALQRQDGVLTNSRLPCSTAEKARGGVHELATVDLWRLEVPRPTRLPKTRQTRQTTLNTWCGAEDSGRYAGYVLHGRLVARFFPRGPRRPEHGLVLPMLQDLGETMTRDPGACSSLLLAVPGLGRFSSCATAELITVPRNARLPGHGPVH